MVAASWSMLPVYYTQLAAAAHWQEERIRGLETRASEVLALVDLLTAASIAAPAAPVAPTTPTSSGAAAAASGLAAAVAAAAATDGRPGPESAATGQ